jgi:ribosomal-protein-alanine N-acetyltransferase
MTETLIRIPTLSTERLVLRAPLPSDFDAYADFRASERARMLGGPFTRIQSFDQLAGIIGHWQLRGFGRWIVADGSTDAPLGIVGLFYPEGWPEPEIAWSVFGTSEGRGIAFEAATAARDYAYRVLGWSTVISLINPGNHRSIALARRLGAAPEGVYAHAVHGDLDIYRHPAPEAA